MKRDLVNKTCAIFLINPDFRMTTQIRKDDFWFSKSVSTGTEALNDFVFFLASQKIDLYLSHFLLYMHRLNMHNLASIRWQHSLFYKYLKSYINHKHTLTNKHIHLLNGLYIALICFFSSCSFIIFFICMYGFFRNINKPEAICSLNI